MDTNYTINKIVGENKTITIIKKVDINDILEDIEEDTDRYNYYRNQYLMNVGCECMYCDRLYDIHKNSEKINCCIDCYELQTEEETKQEIEQE